MSCRTAPSEKYYSVLVAARKQPHSALVNKFSTPQPTIAVWIQICATLLAPRANFTVRFNTSRGELFQLYQAQEPLVKGKTGMLKNAFLLWRTWKSAPYESRVLFVRTYLMPGKALPDDPEIEAAPPVTEAQQQQEAENELDRPPADAEQPPIDWKNYDPLTTDLFHAGVPNQSGQCRLVHKNHMYIAFTLLQLRTMFVHILSVCHSSLQKEAAALDAAAHEILVQGYEAQAVSAKENIVSITASMTAANGDAKTALQLQLQQLKTEQDLFKQKVEASAEDVKQSCGPKSAKFAKEFPDEVLSQSLVAARAGAHDATLCAGLKVWNPLHVETYLASNFNRVYIQGSGLYTDTKEIQKSLADLGDAVGWGTAGAVLLAKLALRPLDTVPLHDRARFKIASTFYRYATKVLFAGTVDDEDEGDEDEGDEEEEDIEPRTCNVYTGNMYASSLAVDHDAFQPDFQELLDGNDKDTRVVVLTSPPWGYSLSPFDQQPGVVDLEVSFTVHHTQAGYLSNSPHTYTLRPPLPT